MEKLTKAQLKEARKLEWQEKARKEEKSRLFRKIAIWGGSILGIIAFVGILVWLASSPPATSNITVTPVSSDKDIAVGSKSAKATLIEYADFQCPACKAADPMINILKNDYKDDLLYVYRFFPLTSIHKNALVSARAGYAAHLQDKFWEMKTLLYENQDNWKDLSNDKAIDTFVGYAKEIGIDSDEFKTDLSSETSKQIVEEQQAEGLNAGVNSTPTFVLNGKQISNPGSYDQFKKLIGETLNSSK